MPFILIDDSADLPSLRRALARDSRIALDCEAAGFHRYSDRLSLLQITTSDTTTLIVDPLAFDPGETLRGPLGDPAVEVLMHGADYDLRLLDRDLDVLVHGLFDTQVAAGLLGESSLGLAALLDQHLGVKLSKKYQRADWGRRPLPDDMLAYAAADTRHLRELGDLLRDRLARAGRLEWALEECRLLEETRWTEEPNDEDPVVRVRGARDLAPREVTALRAALKWRDRIARERDRAPFRVAGDQALLEVVVRRPRSAEELAEVRGMSPALARQEGAELIEQLDGVDRLPDAKLVGYPRRPRIGPGRTPPEVDERVERLKQVRNRRADELRIDRGTLLPNAVLLEVARLEPRSAEELAVVPGMRHWQAEVLGEALLTVLNRRAAAR